MYLIALLFGSFTDVYDPLISALEVQQLLLHVIQQYKMIKIFIVGLLTPEPLVMCVMTGGC